MFYLIFNPDSNDSNRLMDTRARAYTFVKMLESWKLWFSNTLYGSRGVIGLESIWNQSWNLWVIKDHTKGFQS